MRGWLVWLVVIAACDRAAAPPPPPPSDTEITHRLDELSRKLEEVIAALATVQTDDARAVLKARLRQLREEADTLRR